MKVARNRETWEKLGRALATARTYAGLTQTRAADALGLSRAQLLAIEYAEREPSADELRAMITLYSVTEHGDDLPLSNLIALMHPDDLAALHHLAVILRADRIHRQRIEERAARLNKALPK